MACRYAAQKLDPDCRIEAQYVDHERVGWLFRVHEKVMLEKLELAYGALMQGRPLPVIT